MPFVIKSNIYCDSTEKIVAVFCNREDALEYVKNNEEKFADDDDTPIFEYWHNDLMKSAMTYKYIFSNVFK
jgi:hypothetical protein